MITLTQLKLILGRNPNAGFPEGDDRYGYVIVAPLTHEGLIDPIAWHASRSKCKVVRFSPDPQERADGWLSHLGGKWRIHYEGADEGSDEAIDNLSEHRLFVHDYVTIKNPVGDALVYQVVDNRDVGLTV